MLALIGLGNPGTEYERTRHNFGFRIIDKIVDCYRLQGPKQKHQGLLFNGTAEGHKILAFKPTTFMNLSGNAVQALMAFYKLKPENVIVLHDDLDLALGIVRAKIGGGAGGHNGLKSLDAAIGKNYKRVRLGIDHPGDKDQVSDYVLNKFTKQEEVLVEDIIDTVVEHIKPILGGDDSLFMTRVNEALRGKNGI